MNINESWHDDAPTLMNGRMSTHCLWHSNVWPKLCRLLHPQQPLLLLATLLMLYFIFTCFSKDEGDSDLAENVLVWKYVEINLEPGP